MDNLCKPFRRGVVCATYVKRFRGLIALIQGSFGICENLYAKSYCFV